MSNQRNDKCVTWKRSCVITSKVLQWVAQSPAGTFRFICTSFHKTPSKHLHTQVHSEAIMDYRNRRHWGSRHCRWCCSSHFYYGLETLHPVPVGGIRCPNGHLSIPDTRFLSHSPSTHHSNRGHYQYFNHFIHCHCGRGHRCSRRHYGLCQHHHWYHQP